MFGVINIACSFLAKIWGSYTPLQSLTPPGQPQRAQPVGLTTLTYIFFCFDTLSPKNQRKSDRMEESMLNLCTLREVCTELGECLSALNGVLAECSLNTSFISVLGDCEAYTVERLALWTRRAEWCTRQSIRRSTGSLVRALGTPAKRESEQLSDFCRDATASLNESNVLVKLWVVYNTVKPPIPAASTDRPLPYIDRLFT